MATPSAAILCCLLALLLWMPLGWLIARRLPLEDELRLAAAPILGWAVQSVVALQVSMFGGFTPMGVMATTAVIGLAATLAPPSRLREGRGGASLSLWILVAVAVVAAGPAAGVLPKISPAGIALADPLYDHAKVALVDEMVRTGVPPANPFLGTGHGRGSIAYYYYWLFGAAELALLAGASGWEADVAATWFTAFASLALMGGLAFRLSGARAASAAFVVVAACGGSLRPVLTALSGQERMDDALERATGLAGWFFQTSWSPHHVASATAVLLSFLLMERLARATSVGATLVLGLLIAASFGSSLWVGGVTFMLCAGAVAMLLFVSAPPGRRLFFLAAMAAAGCIAVALILPLLAAQLHSAADRGGGPPVLISAFPVLGPAVPNGLRGWLDIPAYWLILLFIEFPAAWVLGTIAMFRLKSALIPALPAAAFASLGAGSLLVSTIGENNDLGWRAVLPGVMILTAFAGAGFAQLLARRCLAGTITGLILLSLALPDGLGLLHNNIVGRLSADGGRFRDAPALWTAVRRHTAPDERIASNPRLTSNLTPWPVNLSWALLANRRSCFAGDELALAFTALSPQARERASELFDRIFDNAGSDDDIKSLVKDFDCKVAVFTPQDGAWSRDPLASSGLFTRVEEAAGRWRIYRVKP
jgi:hypothetical protein